jgi:WD40 repeat protein
MNILREGMLVVAGVAVAVVVALQANSSTDQRPGSKAATDDALAAPTTSATVPILDWSDDGKELLALVRGGEFADTISILSVEHSQEVYHFDSATHSISTAALLPGRMNAVIGYYRGELSRVRSDSAEEQPFASIARRDAPTAIAVSPDGKTLAVAFEDFSLAVFDIPSAREMVHRTRFFDRKICSLRFSPDGLRLVAASQNGRVAVLGARRLRMLREFHCSRTTLRLAAFASPEEIVTVGFDGNLGLWNLRTESLIWSSPEASASTPAVDVTTDGRFVALGSFDAAITLWDLSTRESLQFPAAHARPVVSVAFSPDGSTLASGSLDGSVRLWQIASRTSRVLVDFNQIAGDE